MDGLAGDDRPGRSVSPALKAAGFIGTWRTDVSAGRSVLDEGAAAFMAGDARLAGRPLTLDDALSRLHPDDRDWVFERIARVRHTGGSFSAEFRIRDHNGEVRWVLNRGRIFPDATGAMQGQGAYIDTTDIHQGTASPALSALELAAPSLDPLDIAIDHCIAARNAIEQGDKPFLRLMIDMLLLELGRALARRRGA
ncbi:PAS domain-containing protein [Methylobacterium planeticum]|uniref:PAS domain-containing protein n=2 Tax=Methylobacterium planeticum TaxID=2615211 RepID=A0A6N6MNK8_9HYPH|nr:PAS domain-containing protein [Methylobacterium planeticum]